MRVRGRFSTVTAVLLVPLALVGCSTESGELSEPVQSSEPSQSSAPDNDSDEDPLTAQELKELLAPVFMHGSSEDAEYVDGWDYADCSDIEKAANELSEAGCEYALEVHYAVETEDVRYAVLLTKPSQPDQITGLQGVLDSREYQLQDDAIIDGSDPDHEQADLGPVGSFAGVVVASTTNEDVNVSMYVKRARNYVRDVLSA